MPILHSLQNPSPSLPSTLNNPFSKSIPEIARIAAQEFQIFISSESQNWNYDFQSQKGKMFGVLVVQDEHGELGYLGTVSGKLPGKATCSRFVPSVFDSTQNSAFLNKGMTQLTEMSLNIQNTKDEEKTTRLKKERKAHSTTLQQRLFENYIFQNLSGEKKNLLEIFKDSSHGPPPSAAGECAAPKLLQFALSHQLRPIALAEFWWGGPIKTEEREHGSFYPACLDRCRPILEFMLEDDRLYTKGQQNNT